ncbi:MAG: peptidylprolyl isomerase [Deltaproteobacteria bacterium]|nr:peptidylprolyl isomerase [Deltaproteobacteria bacterium]
MIPSYWSKKTTTLLATAGLVLVLVASGWAEDKKGGAVAISDGKQVSLEYTLTLEEKGPIDSNVGKEPLVYTQGSHEIIPGLEKQLAGLKVGESKLIEISPEDGYGPVRPELKGTQEIDKTKIPEDARKVGAKLTGQGSGGQPVFAEVTEVKENTVMLTVDSNHPLAGKKLIFDVKVLKVENAPEKKVEMPAAAPEKPKTKSAK